MTDLYLSDAMARASARETSPAALIMSYLRQVEDDLDRIRNAASQQELMDRFKDFGNSLVELTDRAGRRQQVRLPDLSASNECVLYRTDGS